MAKGTYGAYTRLTPIQQDFGRNSDQQLAKFNMLKGQQDAQAQAERERQEGLASAYAEDISGMNMDFSGIKSVDQINMDFVNTSKQALGNMYREMRENPALASDSDFMLRMSNLKNGPKLMAQAQGVVTEYATDLMKGMQDGTYSNANQQALDELEAIYGFKNEDGTYSPNYRIMQDKQGMPVMIGKTKDGRIFQKSIAEMASGVNFGAPVKTFDYDTFLTNKSKQLGARVKSNYNQGLITRTQSFDFIADDVRKGIEGDLGTPDNPSDMAQSIWVDKMGRKLEDLNQEAIDEIADGILKDLRLTYDESKQHTGRIQPQPKVGESTKQIPKGTIDPAKIQMITNTDGQPVKVYSAAGQDMPGGAYGYALPEPVSLGLNNDRRQVSEVYVGDNGVVYMKGQNSIRDTKSPFAAYNTEEFLINSQDNLSDISLYARKMNFPNVNTLIKTLQQQKPKPSADFWNPNTGGSNLIWEQ